MPVVSMRDLLEAGVHFGHQTRRWNPKRKLFIFAERGGIYIIDLKRTQELLDEAYAFARNIAERGGSILFVGTKKQAQDAVSEEAKRVGMPYVNHRWLGGLLTNWRTISDRIERLHELRRLSEEGQLDLLPAKERISMHGELEKLEANLGGVADMRRQPDAIFIVDLRKEQLAVREARRLGMPIIALVDTN
jgi:small subunit ribosomal protein S2